MATNADARKRDRGEQDEGRRQQQRLQQSQTSGDSIPAVVVEMQRLGLLSETEAQLLRSVDEEVARKVLAASVEHLKASGLLGRGTYADLSEITRRAEAVLAVGTDRAQQGGRPTRTDGAQQEGGRPARTDRARQGGQPARTDRTQQQHGQTRQQPIHIRPTPYQLGRAYALYQQLVEDQPTQQQQAQSTASVYISKEMDELVGVLAYVGRCQLITERQAREILKPREENQESAQQRLLNDVIKRINTYENVTGRSAEERRQLLRTRSVLTCYRCAKFNAQYPPSSGQTQAAPQQQSPQPPRAPRSLPQQRDQATQQQGPAMVTMQQANITQQPAHIPQQPAHLPVQPGYLLQQLAQQQAHPPQQPAHLPVQPGYLLQQLAQQQARPPQQPAHLPVQPGYLLQQLAQQQAHPPQQQARPPQQPIRPPQQQVQTPQQQIRPPQQQAQTPQQQAHPPQQQAQPQQQARPPQQQVRPAQQPAHLPTLQVRPPQQQQCQYSVHVQVQFQANFQRLLQPQPQPRPQPPQPTPLSQAERDGISQILIECQRVGLLSAQQTQVILQADMNADPAAVRDDLRRGVDTFRRNGGDATPQGRALIERCEAVWAIRGRR